MTCCSAWPQTIKIAIENPRRWRVCIESRCNTVLNKPDTAVGHNMKNGFGPLFRARKRLANETIIAASETKTTVSAL